MSVATKKYGRIRAALWLVVFLRSRKSAVSPDPRQHSVLGSFRPGRFILRLVLVGALTLLVVGSGIVLVDRFFEIDWFTKRRLAREGYGTDVAAVHRAIGRADFLALTRLKAVGVPLDQADASGQTPFQKAVLAGRLDLVHHLTGLGVEVDLSPVRGRPLEVLAMVGESREMLPYLLAHGGNPDVEVETGQPALVWAIRGNRDETFDLLLKKGASIRNGGAGGSPLAIALRQGNLRAVGKLLSLGAEADGFTVEGKPLTVDCLERGRPDLVKRLVMAGASPETEGTGGESLMEASFRLRSKEIFQLCLMRGADMEKARIGRFGLLESACQANALDWVELLLQHRADASRRSEANGEALWWNELRQGRPAVAEILLGAGADVDGRNKDGLTPIERAIEDCDFRLTRYLFGKGAKAPGSSLWGPMQAKRHDVMRLLAAHGDDLNNPTSTGFTLLGFAVTQGDVTAASVLFEYGARYDPNDRPGGHRLLEWAIANRQAAMAELLLENGADPNARLMQPATPEFLARFSENGSLSYRLKNERNLSPIMLAAGSKQLDLAKALVKKGAQRNRPTSDHTYPVTFAINAGDIPMAQLMLGREPETDGKHARKIVVSIDEQKARFYKDGELLYATGCSTGRSGFRTPRGTFVITDKARLRHSTLYGSAMPFFMRLSGSAVGMHQGNCPGYPASHGCIRLPYTYAKNFFSVAEVGDVIVVE